MDKTFGWWRVPLICFHIVASLDHFFHEDRFCYTVYELYKIYLHGKHDQTKNKGGLNSQTSGDSSLSSLPLIRIQTQEKEVDIEPKRRKRAGTIKDFGEDFQMYNVEDPKNLTKALSSVDANLWQEAINDEIDSLESNRTWHLVDLSLGCKAIGCKWVLRKKLKPDGSVDKYKARLVTKKFRQRANIDFFDTFSLVTRIQLEYWFL